ncbi:DUF2934 domain-containing protein [Bradyrhizobium sp. PMVTL-01]|uniref:DUF2934 domain-containing protein n=1 Tax=Bradyrhizobium sp. PMVTL-01 TaxID=3434999 RepID=UPI003F712B1C
MPKLEFRFAHPPANCIPGNRIRLKRFVCLNSTGSEQPVPTAVFAVDEQQKIERQIEFATRAAALVKDETTGQRFRSFAEELKRKLFRMMRRGEVRARAYELWEQAGRPTDRDLDFWLEAEREIEVEREERKGSGA